ncbi:transglycosylase SLT domain protein [Oceaniovalibus guishaninsula JLT2003]|uniref:Transglycosylase SLT domain protein n=1 Tax=Oceaniovalibus guishaninsula JLT2003 TaxID=1231392 RepID=K2I6V7_9RHOB|nr:lytic transglycosylase domain-containing protein [Oceaniovalibus guishaninsula]EKE44725.1 transglycosylase SLT domain protein [Oceaniovalibus guishaninsula JLT2003]
MRIALILSCLALAACAGKAPPASRASFGPADLPELNRLIDRVSDEYRVPRSLVHRIVQRESGYRPQARNGPYMGLMQILPETAATMGHRGPAADLLNAETNLRYAVPYLRGAWIVADGNEEAAVGWYARGYYYEARNRCLLVETGLKDREVAKNCR